MRERSNSNGEVLAEPAVTPAGSGLTANEELQLQQLLQLRYWYESHQGKRPSEDRDQADTGASLPPPRWELTRGITLHDWQRECVDRWFEQGRRGISSALQSGWGLALPAGSGAARNVHPGSPEALATWRAIPGERTWAGIHVGHQGLYRLRAACR